MGDMNVITTLINEQLVDLKGKEIEVEESFRNRIGQIKKEKSTPPEKEVIEEDGKKATFIALSPYKVQILSQKETIKTKKESRLKSFVELLKKLYANIPFSETLSKIPIFVKILKKILSKKRKLKYRGTIRLTAKCSDLIQHGTPPKLGYHEDFSIPCEIDTLKCPNALFDLGDNVSMICISIHRRLSL